MPFTIRVEFNILRFEAPAAHDPAAEHLIMGASAVALEFGRGAATAVTILAEVCPDETFAAKCVEETTRRAKQEGFDWPPNAASLERETPETRLPVTAFPNRMLDALCHFLENELMSPCTREGELIVAESDYLAGHPASCECFRPLADFSDPPSLVNLVLAAHVEAPMLAVRDGVRAPRKRRKLLHVARRSPFSRQFGLQDIPKPK
jgi:hypothetical protein